MTTTPVVLLAVLVLAAFVGDLSWPASGWLAGATTAYVVVRRSTTPWLVAAREVLLPAAIGFGLLTACLLFYNLRYDPGHWITTSASLADAEVRLVSLWEIFKGLDLGISMIGVFLLLVVLARWRLSWRPVSGLLRLHRVIGRVAAVLATVTSFSFLTNEAVGGAVADRAVQHLAVHYVGLRNEEEVQRGRYLAVRVIEGAVRNLPDSSKQYLRAALLRVDATATDDQAAKRQVASQLGERYAREWSAGVARSPGVDQTQPSEPIARLKERLHDDPRGLIAAQTVRTASATGLADAELSDAVNRMASSGLDLVGEGMVTLLGALLGPTIDIHASLLADIANRFFKEVADSRLEDFIRPHVDRLVGSIQSGVRGQTRDGRSPDKAAEVAVENVLAARSMSQERRVAEREEPARARAAEPLVDGYPSLKDLLSPAPKLDLRPPAFDTRIVDPFLRARSYLRPDEQARVSVLEGLRRTREARDPLRRKLVRDWRYGRPPIIMRPRYRPRLVP